MNSSTNIMNTYEARLASFEKAQAGLKGRHSNVKGVKGAKWPHRSPSAVELAHAGFFFRPTPSAPDNVQCFSCKKDLDGWDQEDVAIQEHRQLSPDCGFALNMGIEYDIENELFEPNDTDSMKMLEARKATFKFKWPHEDKRGWTCKTQKMAEGGWYYCPTLENDDMVKCAYCGLSLDGWEPKDNPLNEHQRRAPDCVYFSFALGRPIKAARTAKGRLSKASRLSTQSNTSTRAIEDLLDDDDSAMTNLTINSTASKSTKRAGTGGKPRNKAREAAIPEVKKDHDIQDIDMGEPDDAGFDVVIPKPVTKSKRGKKRMSGELETSDPQNAASQGAVLEPPPKRRANRKISRTVTPEQVTLVDLAQEDQKVDTVLSEKEAAITEQPVRLKKGSKRTRKRASSTVQQASHNSVLKASNASTASKAALQTTAPTDSEVDAALAADLDRPLTDEENEQTHNQKIKTCHLTRTKPDSRTASRNVSALAAPIRRVPKTSIDSQKSSSKPDVPKGKQNDSEQVASAPPQDIPSLDFKPKKGQNVAKAVITKSVQTTQEASTMISTTVESEQLTPEAIHSPDHLTTVLHHEVAASTSQDVPVTIDNVSSAQARDTNDRVSAESTGRTRSTSYDTIEMAEENSAEIRKTEVKVEIQRHPSHSQQQVGTVKKSCIFSADNDEMNGSSHKIPQLKKKKAKRAEGQTAKAAAAILSHSRQLSAEPVAKQEMPGVAMKFGDSKDENVDNPVNIVTVDKHATHLRTKPLGPEGKSNISEPHSPSQSSDAENHPPSTRPLENRPPGQSSLSKTKTTSIPLAASTPTKSPFKRNAAAKLYSNVAWNAIDLKNLFGAVNAIEEGLDLAFLSSPEKELTVEEWILHNAAQGEERLKRECEMLVGAFELESLKALRSLEGIACID